MQKNNLFFLALCLSTLIVSCGSKGIKPADKPKITNAIEIERDWSAFVGLGTSHKDYRYQIGASNNAVYAIDQAGDFYAIDKNNGSRLWQHSLNTPLSAGVTVYQYIAYLGSEDGDLIAFDLVNKKEIWKTQLEAELLHPPVTDGAVVVLQLNNGKLLTIDINSGSILWSAITKNPKLTQRGISTPIIIEGLVVTGFATGRIIFFNLSNGARVWQTEVGQPKGSNEVGRIVDIDGSIYIKDNIFYVGGVNGKVTAISMQGAQPKVIWQNTFSTSSGLTGVDNKVFATGTDGSLIAYDAIKGNVIWTQKKLQGYIYNEPIIWQGYLVVADQKGYINFINVETGSLSALYRAGPNAIQANSRIIDDKLYTLDIGGFLTAISVEK